MIRSLVYDAFFARLTARWYEEVLRRLPDDIALLDVGVGTAAALAANAELVKQKGLRITGIDIDAAYIERARKKLLDTELADCAKVRLESVYDHQNGTYGAVYFSASFMLLPDPEKALRHCCTLLKPGGRIFFTQTIEEQRSRWVEVLKPRLKQLTSIDFGRVTYADDFQAQLRAAGLELEEFSVLESFGARAACLAVARPDSAIARPDSRDGRREVPPRP